MNSPAVPELPETETIARDLNAAIIGMHIVGAEVLRRDVLRGVTHTALARRLTGRGVHHVWRRAKSVVLSLDDHSCVVVTPRFTGALILDAPDTDDPYACVRLDPTFTAERFSGCIRGSRRAIKAVLMDQRRLAGVGNIYATEALWRACIRPSRRASSLTRRECAELKSELTAVLNAAIEARQVNSPSNCWRTAAADVHVHAAARP